MDINSSLDQVVALEQHFMDTLKPNLNVDLVASGSGYHEGMSQVMRNKLRKEVLLFIYTMQRLLIYYIYLNQNNMSIIQLVFTIIL